MSARRVRLVVVAAVGLALIAGSWFFSWRPPAESPSRPPGPRVGKAGHTTDVVPQAWRGEKEDDEGRELARANLVFWRDVVWTARRGRARIVIVDGSILNVGPQTRLRILPQDARTNHSTVELNFGKIRAAVRGKTEERQLEIRTPTAVIGVIGTEFYVDASQEKTRVICLEGRVTVRNRQAEVAGEETLSAGEKTDVLEAAPPAPKKKATAAEIEQATAVTRSTPLDVALSDRRGNRVNLRERGGRVLVLHFWATWAVPSLQDIPNLNRLQAEFRDQPVDFIGISEDPGGWPAIDAFRARTAVNYQVLLDQGNQAARTLGVRGFPTTLVVDQNGRILVRQQGPFNLAALRRALQRLL